MEEWMMHVGNDHYAEENFKILSTSLGLETFWSKKVCSFCFVISLVGISQNWSQNLLNNAVFYF